MALPSSYPDLLPSSGTTTDFERAFAGAVGMIGAVPMNFEILLDPWKCPERFLPWLAERMSVDIWSDAWPIAKRRWVIATEFERHQLKGTLEGFRQYIELTENELIGWVRPPDRFFPSKPFSASDRRSFLARYPQLRLYPHRDKGTATLGMFTKGAWGLDKTFCGDESGVPTAFPYKTDAASRYGTNAYLYEPQTGSETKLRWIERKIEGDVKEAVDFQEILIPGRAGLSLFPGGKLNAKIFPGDSGASGRMIRVRVSNDFVDTSEGLDLKTISPSLDPIDVNPQKVFQKGDRDTVFFAGQIPGKYWLKSNAADRIFDVIHLFDPERAPISRGGMAFAGHFRLGMPSFHGELQIQIRKKRHPWFFGPFVYGHAMPYDPTKLDMARRAVRISKSKRDKIWIDTRTHRPPRFGDQIKFGDDRKFGQLIKV